MASVHYELLVNILIVIQSCFTIIPDIGKVNGLLLYDGWIYVNIFINFLFFFELLADWIVYGCTKAYQRSMRCWPESINLCLNCLAFALIIKVSADDDMDTPKAFMYSKTIKLLHAIVFFRLTRFITLLYELHSMRVIIETIKNLIGPMNNLLAVMVTILYTFALIGELLFGGQIKTDSEPIIMQDSIPDNYYLCNFNDLVSAMVTLFILMIVNNWYVIVSLCVAIKNGNTLYRLYFMIFYYFGVLIGLNILIAFAIDMYSAVERLETSKLDNENYLIGLSDKRRKESVVF